ncbi:MAG: phosphotransferase system enzyme I PtsP [Rhodospirillaceae bacterium]|nr:MAG: phosphotransferase system enzyme I PtsP [Rhodospirillaceae bacterium]
MQEPQPASTSRRLLGRLRDVMAGSGTAEERLNKIVALIADGLAAQVCSCYVMRAGEVLELFATEGLKQSAVHRTRLRVGEGLVGLIAAQARPIALADAWSHAAFVYRPETGEELYHSFMGVPIIRGGRVIGVLVVQDREHRHYVDEDVETLETVAMVLAGLLVAHELIRREELLPTEGNALLPLRLEGVRLSPGVGIGTAVLHSPRIIVPKIINEDPQAELLRLESAIAALHDDLDVMLASPESVGEEYRDVLETYRMFAQDHGWKNRIHEAIRSGLTAEAAVQKVQDDTRLRMNQVTDSYIRERLYDLQDLANRILQHLTGARATAARGDLPEDTIVVARSMGPAELLDYDRRKLRGLVMEEGSANMHVAIIARALDIPVLARVKEAVAKIEPYDPIIVDGEYGQVFIRPGEDIQQAFHASLEARRARAAHHDALRDLPAETLDGVRITMLLNAGLLLDMQNLQRVNADGVGLYRTEVPFMARPALPDVEAQTILYGKILALAEGRPVAFRTLDVGGDKLLPYWNPVEEPNPAMGWRSIRVTLDRPLIMRHQLRALIRAAAGQDLDVMFPMVTAVAEFDAARALLDREIAREHSRGGVVPRRIRVGAMLEVPALMWQLRPLLQRVDFVSIGSNDLAQFLFANDRTNTQVADRYDVLSPPFLYVLHSILKQCEAAGVPCSVCGEMVRNPLEAMALIGLGFRRISMAAPSFGAVKGMVRSMSVVPVQHYLETLLHLPHQSVRERLRMFALDHNIAL